MKIFDCFLFFNELEILELRLLTLSEVVDYFVLVEANKTFTDNKKEFFFEENRNRFKEYLDKIIYVKVKDAPHWNKHENVWSIEYFQRDCITRGLTTARDEDKIIISDVDEIPDPERILQIKHLNDTIALNQYLFYYYVNCMAPRTWNGSIITPFKNMLPPQKLRDLARKGLNKIEGSGWHYSYMGGVDRIRLKLDNLSNAFTVMDQVGTQQDIVNKVNARKCLWDEGIEYRLVDIEKNNYAPKSMKKFLEKYPEFFLNQN